jgi:hypothetical protein
MTSGILLLFLFAIVWANPVDNVARDDCKPCNPEGATGTDAPKIGPELKSLYVDVLESVKDIHFRKRWTDSVVPRADAFCCKANLDCVNVVNLNIPMCYDKFTTQYAFPDGSWGSLTTGEFRADDGSANLINGTYVKATENGGQSGEIYADAPEKKPNTTTMSIPPQWTGTGVGSAIPPTEIASVITNAPAPTTEASATTAANGAAPTGTEGGDAAAPETSQTGAAARLDLKSKFRLEIPILGAVLYGLNGL